mgnify:FL=1
MRDLLDKLNDIALETALNPADPKDDYKAKKKALQDLQLDPNTSKDPELKKAVIQRKADLDKEAKSKGVFEVGDVFGIRFTEDFEVQSEIVSLLDDGVVISLNQQALTFLESQGITLHEAQFNSKQEVIDYFVKQGKSAASGASAWERGWRGHSPKKTKVDPIKKPRTDWMSRWEQEKDESFQYENSQNNSTMHKSKVYVQTESGNIFKLDFGCNKMHIKKSNPTKNESVGIRNRWSCRSW